MRALFWCCFALIFYAYAGYALLLWIVARFHRSSLPREGELRTVSIILAAHNEEQNLARKLDNLEQLDYPAERLQVIVASDGSTDGTVGILAQRTPRVVSVVLEEARGKAIALNHAVRQATGEILVFFDARQTIATDALMHLIAPFADPSIGAVSGELVFDSDDPAMQGDGLGIYWKLEKALRRLESETGSVVGVTGAIYAVRRELYRELPAGTLLDDLYVPMQVARAGKRVVFQPLAIARDRIFLDRRREFLRKVRTLTGNYQLIQLEPWLLTPSNPLLFRFISHKLLRLIVPLLLVVQFVASGLCGGPLYRTLFLLQAFFYGLALLGVVFPPARQFKPVNIANTFVMLNAAAARAFYNFVTGHDRVWA